MEKLNNSDIIPSNAKREKEKSISLSVMYLVQSSIVAFVKVTTFPSFLHAKLTA